MRRGEIDIHIDRISLPAMPSGGERRLREAVTRALARLGSEPAAARNAGAPHAPHPEGVAADIAGQVHAGLPGRPGR